MNAKDGEWRSIAGSFLEIMFISIDACSISRNEVCVRNALLEIAPSLEMHYASLEIRFQMSFLEMVSISRDACSFLEMGSALEIHL